MFLDSLVLPYVDDSPTTTPVDPPPSTSGRHVSISGGGRSSHWSVDSSTSTETGSDATSDVTPSDVTPPSAPRSLEIDDDDDDESRDVCGTLTSPARRMTSSHLTAVAAVAARRGSLDARSSTGPSVQGQGPVYRATVASETMRRCEPTHFQTHAINIKTLLNHALTQVWTLSTSTKNDRKFGEATSHVWTLKLSP